MTAPRATLTVPDALAILYDLASTIYHEGTCASRVSQMQILFCHTWLSDSNDTMDHDLTDHMVRTPQHADKINAVREQLACLSKSQRGRIANRWYTYVEGRMLATRT